MNYIIGCGGVGSWLAATMVRLVGANNVVLVDGDTLEKKNLDRQLFTEQDIGQNKADALASQLGCKSHPAWYDWTEHRHTDRDWLMCCVDNNPARADVLRSCDANGCAAICAANEMTSSEAYLYLPRWRNTNNDPRIYYPEIETDQSNNVRHAAGCTGEYQIQNRQLVTANFMAAALAGHLYVVWAIEAKTVAPEVRKFMPHRLNQNLTRNGFILSGEPQQVEREASDGSNNA